ASGGYYIATPARKIFAESTTVTGSIGVFGLIPNAEKLLKEKMGLDFEYVGTGKHSDIGRLDRAITEEEREYIASIIDKIYDTFLSRVAEGRNMTKEQVNEIAQGRVWTGIMAKEIGLVDELGGLEAAIASAAKEAELTDFKIREFPKAKDPFNMLLSKIQGNTNLQAQIIEATKNTGYEGFVKQLTDMKRWGSQHSVQAIMPYDITVRNYSLR
ncbi:MAG: S49 family peptidase, partial [Bacteroidia bacterium]